MSNKPQESARGPKPFRISIVPGGVYAGDGAIFASENLFSRVKIASLQFPRPEIRRILAETGEGGSGGGACFPVHQRVGLFDTLQRPGRSRVERGAQF